MSIPSTPVAVGATLTGKLSWFGGPHDSSDSGQTASGVPEARGGIAVYNRATLGGFWRVKFPDGRTVVEQQTDLGPLPSTGKTLDILYSSLAGAGYTEQNFPTGATATATYLGKTKPPAGSTVVPPPSSTVASSTSSAGSGLTKTSIGSDLLYALLFAAAIATGAILLGLGLNRAGGGAPARTGKRVARVAGAV